MDDVLEFAMQMEVDGRDYYRNAAAGTDNPQITQIFEKLAEEEHRHYNIFKRMKEGAATSPADLAPKGETVGAFKNIFQQMIEGGQDKLAGDTKTDVWKEAREVEIKSEKMYRDAAAGTDDAAKKDMLNRIADEEKNHIYLIDNMISFLSDPATFIASQNYRNFMSWEGH